MNIFVRNRSKKGHQKGAYLCTKNVSTFGTKRGHPGIWVGQLAKSEGPKNGPKNVPRFRMKKERKKTGGRHLSTRGRLVFPRHSVFGILVHFQPNPLKNANRDTIFQMSSFACFVSSGAETLRDRRSPSICVQIWYSFLPRTRKKALKSKLAKSGQTSLGRVGGPARQFIPPCWRRPLRGLGFSHFCTRVPGFWV